MNIKMKTEDVVYKELKPNIITKIIGYIIVFFMNKKK